MLIGNLTRDPNLRYTPNNNTPVVSFGIATNRDWVGENNEKQDQVEFHNIVAWSKLAEICSSLLHKGDKVYVDGRLQTREWKGDDGVSRRNTEIVIENMILLKSASGRSDDGVGAPTPDFKPAKAVAEVAESAEPEVAEVEDMSDDIPF
jgi:single-strand DNA-binding protein